ncbi:MAG: choloylglycine hydrolase family protein [Lachnospiraceae bacterium]|nr:choloylglycine hydrolase family protein [Lachnospiraceae bacterium]
MCTAATYQTKDFYFGRTFDYEFSYGEEVVVTPRDYRFDFRRKGQMSHHYAMIGTAFVADQYPLYYEAVNEKGLGMAGLNFAGNACYFEESADKDNISPFELIPWILSQCKTTADARILLDRINLVNIPFSDQLPLSPLHWIVADKDKAITVESVKDGLRVYDNPVGVMTNNPPFDQQLFSLNNYRHLQTTNPENTFSTGLDLDAYSRGMGGIGLPGDLSSQSRFARVAFTKMNSLSKDDEMSSVSQFFHILESVAQPRGLCNLGNEKYEITIYTSCFNTRTGVQYYNCYDNHQISKVDMHKENLDGTDLSRYPLITEEQIHEQN